MAATLPHWHWHLDQDQTMYFVERRHLAGILQKVQLRPELQVQDVTRYKNEHLDRAPTSSRSQQFRAV